MQTKKVIKVIGEILLLIILFFSGISIFLWYHYSNKNNLVDRYIVDNSKELFILGTIGKKHFKKVNNYSMEDIVSAIENIKPDLVMITARNKTLKNYNIVDGDIDACVAYSYCIDKKIPVKMIDWWIIDNIYPKLSSTNLRDDNIFIKISRILREIDQNTKVLVITNSHNYYEQIARFNIAGFKNEPLAKNEVKACFTSHNDVFKFPPLTSKNWKDRTYFYAYVFPLLIKQNEDLFDSVKDKYVNADHEKFYKNQIKYCKYLSNDILYD